LDRLLVPLLVWALLVATTAAFVVTEALKLERPPVGNMGAPRAFSPTCSCPKQTARLSFRLRRADSIDVAIVDEEENVVRTLAADVRPGRGRVRFRWGGRDDVGSLVPDGQYRLRVHLDGEDRTVTFRRSFAVDTDPPEIVLLEVGDTRVAAGGDGIGIRVELSEPARVTLRVNGRRALRFGLVDAGTETVVWSGTARRRSLPPGEYEIALRARDRAGNRSQLTRTVGIEIVPPGE
jgi:flagellar hook capping protein FlgD